MERYVRLIKAKQVTRSKIQTQNEEKTYGTKHGNRYQQRQVSMVQNWDARNISIGSIRSNQPRKRLIE